MSQFPELKIEGFETYLDDHATDRVADNFAHLGDYSFEATTTNMERLRSGGVHHGFNVISRLIRISSNLYRDAQPEELSVDGLREILLASEETPRRLADMPLRVNSEVEYYFGLTNDTLPEDARDLYRFEPNTSRGTLFILDDTHFSAALNQGLAANHGGNLGAKCPFKNMTVQHFWPQMVNLAADSPRLIFDTIYASQENVNVS